MTELRLSIGEPFTSPAWGSNFVMFSGGEIIPESGSKEYLHRVCKYAKHYQVYLIPERFVLLEYQCMCLISPEGKVLGAQKALHLNLSARTGKRSGTVEVFRTEFGGIFLCVDVDVYRPEVIRVASSMGAQFMACAQTIRQKDYHGNMVLSGAWNAAQLGTLYAMAVSSEFHCVAAPISLTEHGDGFLCPPSLRLPAKASLNADLLGKVRQPRRLSRKFYAIHRNDLLR